MRLDPLRAYENYIPKDGHRWLWVRRDGQAWFCEPPTDWRPVSDPPAGTPVGHLFKGTLGPNAGKHGQYCIGFAVQTLSSRLPDRSFPTVTVSPFRSQAALWLEFIQLAEEPASIMAFANTHGLLNNHDIQAYIPNKGRKHAGIILIVEPVSSWFGERHFLERMTVYWLACINKNERVLREEIFWDGTDIVRQKGHFTIGRKKVNPVICSRSSAHSMNSDWFKHFKVGEVRAPAALYVEESLNRELLGNLSAAIKINLQDFTGEWQLLPSSFSSGLRLELAQHICRGARIHTCVVCKSYYFEGVRIGRKDRMYCSNACKMKAYRSRNSEKHK